VPNPLSVIAPALELLGKNVNILPAMGKAVVALEFSKEKVRLSIRDNGNGFRIPRMLSGFARRSKFGLMGIQERAHLLNGNLKVESKISGGTTIEVEIPTQPSHNSV